MNDPRQLSLIPHETPVGSIINQRAFDGYVNATELCNACDKEFGDYRKAPVTEAFLGELEASLKIRKEELVQIVPPESKEEKEIWVHPQVAINLATWASPKFAVAVSKWIFDWMMGESRRNYSLPYHIRRYLVNRGKIPATHFSMLDNMTLRLLAPLEIKGYTIPNNWMPDISMGIMFSKWLRENGHDPDSYPTYRHVFDDGLRPPVPARLYPNELLTSFNKYFDNVWLPQKSIGYLGGKDAAVIPLLQQVINEIPKLEGNK